MSREREIVDDIANVYRKAFNDFAGPEQFRHSCNYDSYHKAGLLAVYKHILTKQLPEPVGVVRAITPIARTAEFNFNTDLNGNISEWLKVGAKVYVDPPARKPLSDAESYSDALRSLASYVGCGGYNANDPIDAKEFEEKIRYGIDLLLAAQSHQCAVQTARGPLSDDDVRQLAIKFESIMQFARAIEEAHGIKGQE